MDKKSIYILKSLRSKRTLKMTLCPEFIYYDYAWALQLKDGVVGYSLAIDTGKYCYTRGYAERTEGNGFTFFEKKLQQLIVEEGHAHGALLIENRKNSELTTLSLQESERLMNSFDEAEGL